MTEAQVETSGWRRLVASVTAYFPPGQFLRYILVGCFNTVFGYCDFAALNWLLFRHHVPASYMFAAVLATLINIPVAFLGYKWFVFKTKGRYLAEGLKAAAVYTSGMLPTLILLPGLVFLLRRLTPLNDKAPYVANAMLIVFSVIYNFIGHKQLTFRRQYPT